MWKLLLSMTMVIAFSIAVAASYTAVADGHAVDVEFTVDVVPDLSTFSFVDVDGSTDPTPGDPFVVEGDVREEGTPRVLGHYLCRGFFIVAQADGDFTYVHQSFEFARLAGPTVTPLPGIGTIHVQGNESIILTVRSVDGGTGDFEGVKSGVLMADPAEELGAFAFRATFLLDD